jgi:ubiquinone/menaquinone biosynthesis C-methylase UbiE
MEGWVARWYTRTRGHDLASFRAEARRVAKDLPAGAQVLEVAPGPGFFALALAQMGAFTVTGLDLSRTFVEIASQAAADAGTPVEFQCGNASAMPFADARFDFVYCSAAFKNFGTPVAALDEMHRVLKPGGRASIVDLRNDVSMDEIDAYVDASGRGRFDAWFTRLTFRHMLIKRAYSKDQFAALVAESRFGTCRIRTDGIGLDVQLTKDAARSAAA